MDFGLSTEQREIQHVARTLLGERARWERVRTLAEARETDMALWRELCELGWAGIAVAEEYGGQGLGVVALAVLCEELGRVVAPVPFLPSVMAAALIEAGGNEEQRSRWLPGLAGGETTGAVGMARDGVAELVVGGAEAGVLVLLEDNGGRVMTTQDARVQVQALQAIDPTRSAATVSAPAGAGETLPGDVRAGVDRALVATSAELVGVSTRALEMTVAYVKERSQFGVPVGAYQAVSHRCAQMLLETEQARSLTAAAAWAADADPPGLSEAAAMAKAATSDAGLDVTAGAIQMHGGIGFTWEADLHWLYKRAQLDAALLGGGKYHRARLAALLDAQLSAAVSR